MRETLRAQDKTEWVISSTGLFTRFLFEPSFDGVDFENDTVNALGSLETSVTLTTPDDIGKLTADIVFFEPMTYALIRASSEVDKLLRTGLNPLFPTFVGENSFIPHLPAPSF